MIYPAPGVYPPATNLNPHHVQEPASAIPAFVGYTARAAWRDKDLSGQPTRIGSLFDYEQRFGGAPTPAQLRVTLDRYNQPQQVELRHHYLLYAALQLYFANGGGPCYIVSAGPYQAKGRKSLAELSRGLAVLANQEQVTLLLCPDAVLLPAEQRDSLQHLMLQQSAQCGDRFALLDLAEGPDHATAVDQFRQGIGTQHLAFGAAYTPHLRSTFSVEFSPADIQLRRNGVSVSLAAVSRQAGIDSASLHAWEQAHAQAQTRPSDTEYQLNAQHQALRLEKSNPIYAAVVQAIRAAGVVVPPSAAIAGVYVRVDRDRGVWKAPANVTLNQVNALSYSIDNANQRGLNLDPGEGKSINAIRAFSGRGILVWGARTLAGNDPQWRYIPVRRCCSLIEEALYSSTRWAVFEPNDANLWQPLRAMIDRYLTQKWRAGGLQGHKPSEAFYVRVGLGSTMTQTDIDAGRLIIQVGVALVRPAEFIPLRLCLQMQQP
ncbi:MAG TPA: phage tail sheath C-terminal domain-containing protein [Motiliproteus sp.]